MPRCSPRTASCMARGAVALAIVWFVAVSGQARAIPLTDCTERMEGVFTSASGARNPLRLRIVVTGPGFALSGRFRCRRGSAGRCVVPVASVDGHLVGDAATTRYQVSLSRGHGDAYRLLCRLDGTAPFLFGLYLPALEGTYTCDDGGGLSDRGTFQLVGVGRGA